MDDESRPRYFNMRLTPPDRSRSNRWPSSYERSLFRTIRPLSAPLCGGQRLRHLVLANRLVVILQKFAPTPSPVNAVYPGRRISSANVATFIKTARNHFMAKPLVGVQDWGCDYSRP